MSVGAMSRRGLVGVAVGVLLVGATLYVVNSAVIVDTEEDIWPDPRARQGVHLGVLSRRLQAVARHDSALPDSLTQSWPTDTTIRGDAVDLWGTSLQYRHRDSVFVIRSAGPDQRFDTSDDIVMCDGTTYGAKLALVEGALKTFCAEPV